MKIYLKAIFIAFVLAACVKQACDEVYVISGQVMNGTTGEVAANQPLEISVSKADLFNPGYEILTTGKTDDEGKFNLSYKCSKITDGKVKIVSDFFIFENLPVNQNINKTFYISSKGKLKLFLKTNNPLEANNDTFFIARQKYPGSTNKELLIDTHTVTNNDTFLLVHTVMPSITFFYGRGSKNFYINKQTEWFTYDTKSKSFKLSGDPVIDEATIEY